MKAVLISIADAVHDDRDAGVLDTLLYEHFNNIPRTEVSDYLFELKAFGLIEISPDASWNRIWISEYNKKRIAAIAGSASQIGYNLIEFLPSS